MHELSIALTIIDVAAEQAAQRSAARVHAVHLRLGALSGVVREALESAFVLARQGSPLADARLSIEDCPVLLHCAACDRQRPAVAAHDLRCAECGAPSGELVGGRELEIFALEIET